VFCNEKECQVAELIWNAGPVVKLVMLLLVYLSVVSWAIIFYKWRLVRRALQQSQAFLDCFWSKRRLDLVAQQLDSFSDSPLTALFREGYQELVRVQPPRKEGEAPTLVLSDSGADNIARALRRSTTQQTQQLEKYLTFLATTGSTAPFIGLFGTVWGIMDSFHGIGQTGSASLAVVAPGISEALIATAIGLLAAIPAVVGYNYFLSKINRLIGQMDTFSQEFLNIVQHMARRA
jgi:biopolymer transport protein TolQ